MKTENGLVNLTVSNEIINPIVERHIREAVANALGGSDEIIRKVVDQILNQKVTIEGKVSSYSSDNKYSWLDIVLTQKISEAVREELAKPISSVANKIKASLIEHLKTQKGASAVADALLSGFQDTLKNSWRSSIKIELNREKDE